MLAFIKNNPTNIQIRWIKVFTFLICLVPLSHLVWLGIQDSLSANPIEFIERSTGFWALFTLLATLTLTPIRLLTGKAWQIQIRRMLGLFMFFYVILHITTYIWLDFAFDWVAITKDIAKHPRILVGFAAFILSIPLEITSTKNMMKRLGTRWKQLHQSIYLIAVLSIVHFWWLVKKDIREPLLYACILTILFGVRIYYKFTKEGKNSIKVSKNMT